MLTTDITSADEFGRFLNIMDDYSWEAINALMFSSPEELFKHLEISSIADEDWVISDEANIELEPFENLYTTIL